MLCDNDASAYGRKPRQAYERMLAAVESGSVDAIVTWHNDRLHRSPVCFRQPAGVHPPTRR